MIIKNPIEADTKALKALFKQGFGDTDEFIEHFFLTAFSQSRCTCAYDNGRICAALYWFDCFCKDEKIAYLYAITTEKEKRGRGICSALMRHTHNLIEKQGYKGAILVPASEKLFAFYERLGYECSAFINEFKVIASPNISTSVYKLSAAEYLEKRKAHLPDFSISPNSEIADFLDGLCDFYGAKDAVFALRKNQNEFFAVEFLGDRRLIEGIVSHFGFKEGVVRTPGRQKPFAAFYPFNKSTKPPKYLGFAFD